MSKIFSQCPHTHSSVCVCIWLSEWMNAWLVSDFTAPYIQLTCQQRLSIDERVRETSMRQVAKTGSSESSVRDTDTNTVLTVWQSIISGSRNAHTPRTMAKLFVATVDLQCGICPPQTSRQAQTVSHFVIRAVERSVEVRSTERFKVSWYCDIQLNFRWSPSWLPLDCCRCRCSYRWCARMRSTHAALFDTYKKYY